MKFWAPEWWLQTSICSSLWNTFSRVGLSCNLMASRSARSIISRFSNSAAVSRMMSSRIISARMSPLASTWKYKEIFVHTYIYKGCAAISPNKNKTISTLGAVPRCKLSKSKWHFKKWYVDNLKYRSWFKFKLLHILQRALYWKIWVKLLKFYSEASNCPLFYKAKMSLKVSSQSWSNFIR